MKIDTGMAVVIVAVLIFYLRLIGMQRERARQATLALVRLSREPRKKSAKAAAPAPAPVFSILSPSRLDRWIAGAGVLLVLLGVALNARWIPLASIQPYWWIPTALGVLGFSWAFKVPRENADA